MTASQAALKPHPDSPQSPVLCLSGALVLGTDGSGRARFELRAEEGGVAISPPVASPGFRDGLWKKTCFEVFLGEKGSETYWEYNLSPSGDWAVYRFSDYREHMQPADVGPVAITSIQEGGQLVLEADFSLPEAVISDASLSAVIQDHGSRISYWALSHAGERADFHRRDSFSLSFADQP